MEAHQIFWNYHERKEVAVENLKMDQRTLKLVRMMRSKEGETDPQKEAKTAPNSPNGKPAPISSDSLSLCDSLFVNKKWHQSQINNIAKYTDSMVGMNWVRAVASQVDGPGPPGFVALHDSARHVHVVGGGVRKLLELLITVQGHRMDSVNGAIFVTASPFVTTFAWSTLSQSAIHIQDFQLALKKQTAAPIFHRKSLSSLEQLREWKKKPKVQPVDDSSIVLLMVACSIGLPTKKMFNSTEFLRRWKNYRFKNVCQKNIEMTILRDKFGTLEKVGVESKQLVEEYAKNIDLFETEATHFSSVDQYFFEEWYSYPSPLEMTQLLGRATALLHQLFRTRTALGTV